MKSKSSPDKYILLGEIGILLLILILSMCRSRADDVVLPAVGPRPPGIHDKVTTGYLKVFSRTQQTQWGEGNFYYPHTSYVIYDATGRKIKTVENHGSEIDEAPEKIELPPGTYTVKAWSDNDGLVRVSVIIEVARLTSVHLEDGRESDKEAIDPARAIKTPSGQIVGWKA